MLMSQGQRAPHIDKIQKTSDGVNMTPTLFASHNDRAGTIKQVYLADINLSPLLYSHHNLLFFSGKK